MFSRTPLCTLAAIAIAALAGCAESERAERDILSARSLDEIRESGELVVLTTEGPTSWEGNSGNAAGYEVDLTRAAAEALDVDVRYEVHEDIESVLEAIANGEGDLAAAGITVTEARRERLDFGPVYKTVREQLVCNRDAGRIRAPADLAGLELGVVAGSSHVETLEALRDEVPGLTWRSRPAPSALPLIDAVSRGRFDCTVADSNVIAVARLRHPELSVPMSLGEEQSFAWALPRPLAEADEASAFGTWLDAWFADAHRSGYLAELDERWYGHVDEFDYVEVTTFIRRVSRRLPPLRPIFQSAARSRPFGWLLLAAQGYQESHWDEDAVSPTGVRGVMMLTQVTARELGVRDRTDPEESIRGGALYLERMYQRLPEGISGDDRLYMALAAYNVGYGHLQDARRLARRTGRDPDDWRDVREMLPLLTQEEFYSTVRHGYARGHEPVRYVRNIRLYHALLQANLDLQRRTG